jgi:hypothetical protein
MAHKKVITKISVSDAGEQFREMMLTVVLNLKCYETDTGEADGTAVGDAVIDQNFPGNVRLGLEEGLDATLAKWGIEVYKEMQIVIDTYNREQIYLGNETLDAKIALITGGLTG